MKIITQLQKFYVELLFAILCTIGKMHFLVAQITIALYMPIIIFLFIPIVLHCDQILETLTQ